MYRRIPLGISNGIYIFMKNIKLTADPYVVASRRTLSSSALRHSYDDTIRNLLIRPDSKVLCQGFTGKTVTLIPTRPEYRF